MKILQVIPYFPPAYAFGGPAKVAFQISRELAKKGHDVTVYTTDAKDIFSRLSVECLDVVDGVKIHYFRNISITPVRWSKLFVTPGMLSKAKNEVNTFDVVHLHEYRTFQNVVIHHYARKHGIPYVLQAHGSLPRIVAKYRLKRIYDVFFGYRLLRDASKVIALSQREAEQCRKMGLSEENITIIPNGIDLSEYGDLPPRGAFRKKFGVDENEKIILYLGRIHKIKGLDILAKAFTGIIKKVNDAKLVIIGPDDGYLGELEVLTKVLRIEDSVLILGPLYSRDKLEAYVDADVYVLPSRYEAFPMAVLEAVACGTPVLLTENCAIQAYFKDRVGLVSEPYPEKMKESLLEMLQNDKLMKCFKNNCREIIGRFEISELSTKLEEVYGEAVTGVPKKIADP